MSWKTGIALEIPSRKRYKPLGVQECVCTERFQIPTAFSLGALRSQGSLQT